MHRPFATAEFSRVDEVGRWLVEDGDTEAIEVEIGVGKGRFLIRRASLRPRRKFLGIEVAARYFRIARRRSRARGLENVAWLRAEALDAIATGLPVRFADRLHVYFPDPWPKSRHARRRLLEPATLDLVLGLVAPGGLFCFATDDLGYASRVVEALETYPAVEVIERLEAWPDGLRTNYEAKFVREGRAIERLRARLGPDDGPLPLHPAAAHDVVVAHRPPAASAGAPKRACGS